MPKAAVAKIKSAPNWLLPVAAGLVLLLSFVLLTYSVGMRTATLRLNGERYNLTVARTQAARQKGLGGRANLAANHGMLFIFSTTQPECFWMKDMHFSIDIIWLDADKRIQHIEPGVSPKTYPKNFCPPAAAKYVVELPAGTAQKQGLHSAQKLQF
jgi:uncharacterized membrane protein (UPF0127 family)